jgi:hypothetical protein
MERLVGIHAVGRYVQAAYPLSWYPCPLHRLRLILMPEMKRLNDFI